MASDDRRPSGLWFWAFPVAAGLYLLLILVADLVAWRFQLRGRQPIGPLLEAIGLPANLFLHRIILPLLAVWRRSRPTVVTTPVHAYLAFVVLWELGAALVGVVAYGVAVVVCAIVPKERGSGEGADDGKR